MAAELSGGLNHRHEQIINWLICNPDKTQGDCAREFNYTEAWLSQVINSDMFQAAYRKRCDELGVMAVHTMHARLAGAASVALSAAVRRIEAGGASDRLINDTMRTALQGLGYGPAQQPPEPQKHLHLHINAESLEAARSRAAEMKEGISATKSAFPATFPVVDIQPAHSPDILDEQTEFSWEGLGASAEAITQPVPQPVRAVTGEQLGENPAASQAASNGNGHSRPSKSLDELMAEMGVVQ